LGKTWSKEEKKQLLKELKKLASEYYIPFPMEWAVENFPDDVERFIKYMGGELSELTSIKFALGLAAGWDQERKVEDRCLK